MSRPGGSPGAQKSNARSGDTPLVDHHDAERQRVEAGAILRRQGIEVEHRAVAPHPRVLLVRLCLGRHQEVGDHHRAGLVRGVERDRDEVGVADGAVLQDEGAHRLGQPAGGDRGRRFGRIERQGEVDLAVVEQLMERRAGQRIACAFAPEMGARLLEPGPQRRRDRGEVGLVHWALERLGPIGQLGDHVLQEGAADEVGRRGIGEATGMRLDPLEQGGHRARRRVATAAVS